MEFEMTFHLILYTTLHKSVLSTLQQCLLQFRMINNNNNNNNNDNDNANDNDNDNDNDNGDDNDNDNYNNNNFI